MPAVLQSLAAVPGHDRGASCVREVAHDSARLSVKCCFAPALKAVIRTPALVGWAVQVVLVSIVDGWEVRKMAFVPIFGG